MKIYNSLSKKIEEFAPITNKKIIMYICGLTPYDNAHLGHARTYISFDIIKRYFIKKGYYIYHIQNVTDVEDKIINRAREKNIDPIILADEFQKKADAVFDNLNILRADVYPKVSLHIKEIIEMIEKIIKNGYGYITKDGVYFNVSNFKGYGKLSGQKLEELKTGKRKEILEDKKNDSDFALWKIEKNPIIQFESPWGSGRPGWHIECSAMAMKYSNGKTLDIHGGGLDLSFPHHENEIAQTEASYKIPFSKYWMHTGFLTVNGEKMSKSLKNFITIEEILKKYPANAIRLLFAQNHYKSPVDFSESEIEASKKTVERVLNAFERLKMEKPRSDGEKIEHFKKEIDEFYFHMDNDFNTPMAFASFFNLVKKINIALEEKGVSKEAFEYLKKEFENILWIFGFVIENKKIDIDGLKAIANECGINEKNEDKILGELKKLRELYRKEKNYSKSDEIRAKLKEIGIDLEDK